MMNIWVYIRVVTLVENANEPSTLTLLAKKSTTLHVHLFQERTPLPSKMAGHIPGSVLSVQMHKQSTLQ